MNKYKIAIVIMICCLFILSCSKSQPKKQTPPVLVIVTKAETKDVPIQINAIGNVEAYSSVTIKSRVEGQLIKANFKEGQEVRKGQLLLVIDPRPFEDAVKQAEANLLRDKAQLEFAKGDLERYEELIKKELISRQEYEKIRSSYESLSAVVKADQAILENAKLQLNYCYIYSPIDGKVGSFLVHPGNMIKANDTQIVTINQIKPIYVTFTVPEQELFRIKKAMSMRTLKTEAIVKGVGSKYIAQGKIVFIDNMVDPETGTIRLKAEFPNNDKVLWPGQFVNVVITLDIKNNALVIPYRALQTGQKGQYVFVIKEDKTAELREVIPGARFADDAIIEKGLNPGEVIVVDGQIRLTPGAKVEIKNK